MTFSCLSAAATSPVAPRIRGTELLVNFSPKVASLLPAILLFSAVLLCPKPWLDILASLPPLSHLVLTSVSSARRTHSMHLSGFLRVRDRQRFPVCVICCLSPAVPVSV